MTRIIPARRRKFTLYLDFVTRTPEKIRVIAKDASKPNTVYADRVIQVHGKRTIYVSMPISPDNLSIEVFNINAPAKFDPDPSFTVTVRSGDLLNYLIAIDQDTQIFEDFSDWFCEN